jgi:hypothetical protein
MRARTIARVFLFQLSHAANLDKNARILPVERAIVRDPGGVGMEAVADRDRALTGGVMLANWVAGAARRPNRAEVSRGFSVALAR